MSISLGCNQIIDYLCTSRTKIIFYKYKKMRRKAKLITKNLLLDVSRVYIYKSRDFREKISAHLFTQHGNLIKIARYECFVPGCIYGKISFSMKGEIKSNG